MGFLDGIRGIIFRETCTRAINYDKRNLEMNLNAEAAGVKFSLGDFKTETEKIREASEFSELLDNYQYQMCMVCKSLEKNDAEWKNYNKIRIGTLHVLTSFQATLIAFKNDPEGQRSRLDDVIGNLQEYFLLTTREIMPNIRHYNGELKSHTAKGQIRNVMSGTVSKALDIAGLDEKQVDDLIGDLT
jgi:hypothetical protein